MFCYQSQFVCKKKCGTCKSVFDFFCITFADDYAYSTTAAIQQEIDLCKGYGATMDVRRRGGGKRRRSPPLLENQNIFFICYRGPFCNFFSLWWRFCYVFQLTYMFFSPCGAFPPRGSLFATFFLYIYGGLIHYVGTFCYIFFYVCLYGAFFGACSLPTNENICGRP